MDVIRKNNYICLNFKTKQMKREDGFYWIADLKDKTKSQVVAYYEKGTWLFCGSHYMFSDEDLEKDKLDVVRRVQ
ncbi:MAG: hypothetical protein ACYC5G_04025 [Candidatus Doudnabacteria bacterium]